MSRAVILGIISTGVALALTGAAQAATYRCSPNGNDANDGLSAPWRTVQKAAETLRAGDTVVLEDGTYAGGVVHRANSGRAGEPIRYVAEHPGKAVLQGGHIGFLVHHSDWVELNGLTVRDARTRGIRVITSHHAIVRNCVAANNGIEGINSGFADDLLIENNEAYGNGRGYDGPEGYYEIGKGHGIYVACSGDRPVIRNNRSYENGGCGIQINGNPREVYEQRGTQPDGSISGAVVENNVLYRNGRGGGAAMNLMSVRDSLFLNNLFLHTYSGGICLFADLAGTEWGCRNNRFVNNTIHFKANEGRYGMFFMEGSTDNVLRNNVISAGLGPALMYAPDSERNDSDYNVLTSASEPDRVARTEDRSASFNLKSWQARGRDRNSLQLKPEQLFANARGSRPEDFTIAADSPAATAGVLLAGGLGEGLAGVKGTIGWTPRPATPAGDAAASR